MYLFVSPYWAYKGKAEALEKLGKTTEAKEFYALSKKINQISIFDIKKNLSSLKVA